MNTSTADRVTLSIEGMSCGHCVQAVTKVLSALSLVKVRSVVIGSSEIEVAGPHGANDAIAALEDAGYSARVVAQAQAPSSKAGGGCCGGPRSCCG
jgi:copper chaperone